MRNLKKFLALVLAMLMVSACAMTASAAFADQGKIDASRFKAAINGLAGLQVIKGDENGNYNPNKSLSRAETAVIFAKLDAGRNGWKMEWNDETCYFDDVPSSMKWAYAYINYCYENDIMEGIGDGKFAPEKNLTLAELLTLAVKAYDDAYDEYLFTEVDGAGKLWYTNFVKTAKKCNLFDNVGSANFEASATKGQIAQVAWNLYNEDGSASAWGNSGIKANFKVFTAKGIIVPNGANIKVDDTVNGPVLFTKAALNEAIKNFGYEGTYEDYTNGDIFNVVYYISADLSVKKVFDLTITAASKGVEVTVGDVKDHPEQVAINGTACPLSAGAATAVIGDTANTYSVAVSIDGIPYAAGNVPKYYKALAYDTNNDGKYDLVNVTAYELGIFAKDTAAANLVDLGNNVKVAKYTAKAYTDGTQQFVNDGTGSFTKAEVNFNDAYLGLPVVFKAAKNIYTNKIDIDVIAVAEIKTGKLTAMNDTTKVVTIDGTALANDASAKYASASQDYLNQNVTYMTLNGKFLEIVDAKTATKNIEVYVDSATLNADGTATVKGYKVDDWSAIELTVKGNYNPTTKRMVDKKFFQNTLDIYTAADGKSFVASNAAGAVKKAYLSAIYATADNKALGNDKFSIDITNNKKAVVTATGAQVIFEDGKSYKFTLIENTKTAYCTGAGSFTGFDTFTTTAYSNFKVDASYVTYGGTSNMFTKDVVVITKATTDVALNAYGAVDFNRTNAVGSTFLANAALLTATKTYAVVGDTVKFVYIASTGSAAPTAKVIGAVEADGKLVQFLSTTGTYDYSNVEWKYVNVLTGAVETVKLSTSINVVAGKFYVLNSNNTVTLAENGTAVGTAKADRIWIAPKTVYKVTNGAIDTYYAYTSKLVETSAGSGIYKNADATLTGLGVNVKVYTLDGSNLITLNNDKTAAAPVSNYKLANETFTASSTTDAKILALKAVPASTIAEVSFNKVFFVGDTMIIIK